MLLKDFHPRPALVTKTTPVLQPRYPVIDAHNHLGAGFGGNWIERPVSQLLEVLDAAGVAALVDLDGGWGEDILIHHLEHLSGAQRGRFRVFGGVAWERWPELGNRFPEWAAARLRAQKALGADGLKIWKPFGLHVRDHQGALVSPDDPRLDPIWETAAELRWPICVHVADPVAFFDPVDGRNERYEELHAVPEWQFTSPPFPPFLEIVEAMARTVARHPRTNFIAAHVGWYAENLEWVGRLLGRCPNLAVDIGARIAELGRQPYAARRFFLKYQDRILFGTDSAAGLDMYRLHYRFLETDDEYFNYSTEETPPQGRWRIYGLYLPAEVLEKVYYRNAEGFILNPS
jgi:predicted TIM-barrel fold metal-dependent hydrolase